MLLSSDSVPRIEKRICHPGLVGGHWRCGESLCFSTLLGAEFLGGRTVCFEVFPDGVAGHAQLLGYGP